MGSNPQNSKLCTFFIKNSKLFIKQGDGNHSKLVCLKLKCATESSSSQVLDSSTNQVSNDQRPSEQEFNCFEDAVKEKTDLADCGNVKQEFGRFEEAVKQKTSLVDCCNVKPEFNCFEDTVILKTNLVDCGNVKQDSVKQKTDLLNCENVKEEFSCFEHIVKEETNLVNCDNDIKDYNLELDCGDVKQKFNCFEATVGQNTNLVTCDNDITYVKHELLVENENKHADVEENEPKTNEYSKYCDLEQGNSENSSAAFNVGCNNIRKSTDHPVTVIIDKPQAKRLRIHKCSQCSYHTRLGLEEIMDHERLIHGIQPSDYKCQKCSYKTAVRRYFMEHLKTRHSHGTFECDKCSYKASCEIYLKKHKTSRHAIYKCSKCEFAHMKLYVMKKHVKDVHGPLSYDVLKCPHCAYELKCERKMTTHIRQRHGIKPTLQCEFCDFRTMSSECLDVHVGRHRHNRDILKVQV